MNQSSLLFTEPVFHPESADVQYLQRTCANDTAQPLLLQDSVYLLLVLPGCFDRLIWFRSGWAREFDRQETVLPSFFSFANEKGRCSAESSPFFTLVSPGASIDFAICTSGNYRVELRREGGRTTLLVCNPDRDFSITILPGKVFHYPEILAHRYRSMEECYLTKQNHVAELLSDNWFYRELPVIYNHWWAYEDRWVNEDILLENARIAREIGAEMLVLDAGWFGCDDPDAEAFSVRGDWNQVNRSRFPHGLVWLKEQLAQMGLSFGIWCELETVGEHSELLKEHPEWMAERDGERLPCLCFAIPEVQDWAYETMKNLFAQCGSAYWKLDFNIDPGMGCNAPGHNHTEHDGLLRHYEGLYRVMDRLRREFPELVIENCSSGGQRLNLEMNRHSHVHFLSDADYSVHQMRLFKETSKWLLPKQILHFMWSGTRTPRNPLFPSLDLDSISPGEIRYHMRLAMLHPFGISHRLTEYSPATLSVMKDCLRQYRDQIRPYIAEGTYLPLYLSQHVNVFSFTKDRDSLLFLFAEEPEAAAFSLAPLLRFSAHTLSVHTEETAVVEGFGQMSFSLTDLDTREEIPFRNSAQFLVDFVSEQKWTCRLLRFSG